MFVGSVNPVMTAAVNSPPWFRPGRPNIILDCDIGPDTDDMIHMCLCIDYHKRGLINLLGFIADCYNDAHGPGMRALLDANGLQSAIVGVVPSNSHTSNGFTADLVNRYRYGETSASYPSATSAFRQMLASAPDQSVIVLSGGGLTAQQALLQSAGDSFDSRGGIALVAAKVKLWAGMIGFINYGTEYNVELDRPSAVYTAANWPSPMIWVGGAFGGSSYNWADPTLFNIDEWKTPSAYCAMRNIDNVGWDIGAFWAALMGGGAGTYGGGTFLWPRGVNGTVTVDLNSGLPTFVGNNGGNRHWYDLIIGQQDVVGSRLTDMVRQMLPRTAKMPPVAVSVDFTTSTYVGTSASDFVCNAPAGRTATNNDGSTVTFGAGQLAITNQGLNLNSDLIEIKGAALAAMSNPKVTIVVQSKTLTTGGAGRIIAGTNGSTNYGLIIGADGNGSNFSCFNGIFSGANINAVYLPSNQTLAGRTKVAVSKDAQTMMLATNGAFSQIKAVAFVPPTRMFLGTNPGQGETSTGIVEKITVYTDTVPACLLIPATTIS